MAYMDQERKSRLAPAIKAALAKHGLKATIAVRHHSTLVINISAGKLDFIANYNETLKARDPIAAEAQAQRPELGAMDINPYWYQEHFSGQVLEFLKELFEAAMAGNHNRSDLQSDYHDVGWYVDVNVGKWDQPYQAAA